MEGGGSHHVCDMDMAMGAMDARTMVSAKLAQDYSGADLLLSFYSWLYSTVCGSWYFLGECLHNRQQ